MCCGFRSREISRFRSSSSPRRGPASRSSAIRIRLRECSRRPRNSRSLRAHCSDRLLVIDEAYVDFASENALGLLRRFPNVVILRTLSKSFSLAGMRLGLCFARPAIIEELMKVKDSYNLSRVALAAGAEALNDAVVDAPQCRASETHPRREYRASAQNGIRSARLLGELRARADTRATTWRRSRARFVKAASWCVTFPPRCCATRCGFRSARLPK